LQNEEQEDYLNLQFAHIADEERGNGHGGELVDAGLRERLHADQFREAAKQFCHAHINRLDGRRAIVAANLPASFAFIYRCKLAISFLRTIPKDFY